MKLRHVTINNFRCLEDISIPISDNTVLVGENNSGKTAFLDALRIALPWRASSGKAMPFDEYDFHAAKPGDSPQSSEGITVVLWFSEDQPDEWPETLVQALNDIIQTDPVNDVDSIGIRLTSVYDEAAKSFSTKWEFLNFKDMALGGKGASRGNVGKFLQYIRYFYLSSLRNSNTEFSPRSQFWGRILKDIEIDEQRSRELTEELLKLNEELLKADPRIERVRESLENGQRIMDPAERQATSIHALPLKPWDLMSKSEVVVRARGSEIDLPLSRHGQGMQSLAVLFLFQAYIDVLLKPSFHPETGAILAMEEPEAHLHPQATRSLASNLEKIASQKIVSSHSPYFIQEIPFFDIRMFRRNGPSSKVCYVKRFFSCNLDLTNKLEAFCSNNSPKYFFNKSKSLLTLRGKMEENEYRKLCVIYAGQNDLISNIKRMKGESVLYLDEDELRNLETFVKRVRGEVLFARAWLLCEGQSEYALMSYFSELSGTPLDQYGVSIIDFQNNGSPGAFVGLAETYEIPWLMFCDGDHAGRNYVEQVRKKGLTDEQVSDLTRLLPETDLEMFLVMNGFMPEYLRLLGKRSINPEKNEGETGFEEEVARLLRKNKRDYAHELIEELRKTDADSSRIPPFIKKAIYDIIKKAV